MPKSIYEEAIADVRRLKEVAESNAKREIIEAVTPRIKDLIDRHLLGESLDEEGDLEETSGVGAVQGVVEPPVTESEEDESKDDKSTLVEDEPMYEVTSESVDTLMSFAPRVKSIADDKIELRVYELSERANELVSLDENVKVSGKYIQRVDETIREIEDMYSHLQESPDSARKSKLESKLENCFQLLNAVRESAMNMKELLGGSTLSEDKELTMKVTGLPDDVELDKLNIDLVTDEEGEEGAEAPAGGELPAAPEASAPEMPTEADEMMDEEEVVEISEAMLAREIARMKRLMESDKVAPVTAKGKHMDADVLDDFGGGCEEGDAWLDSEVSTAKKDNMVKQVAEGEDCAMEEEESMMGEAEEDIQGKMDDDHLPENRVLVAKRSLARAEKASTLAKSRFTEAKATYEKYRGTKFESRAKSRASVAYRDQVKCRAQVAEARAQLQKVIKESARNSDSTQLAEAKAAIESLRKQLVETNLLNAKLIHANKLLQSEGLSAKQKATIIDKLDEAQSLREVKLVYESLSKALSGDRKVVKEGVAAVGSSSRPTRPSSTAIVNEGVETARWAKLAGLLK